MTGKRERAGERRIEGERVGSERRERRSEKTKWYLPPRLFI